MKNISKLKLILAILLITNSAYVKAQITKVEIRATGLTCSMCSNAINKQLKTLPEVLNIETDLNTSTFTVTLKEENELSPKIFKDKVEKAGFFIGSLILTAKSATIDNSTFIKVSDKKSDLPNVEFQVLDKGYVTEKEYKKLVKLYKNIETYASINEEDFHIKIIN
jgi:copper chaperone CopZ